MKNYALVIGDVHGMIDPLEQLLEKWDKTTEELILVGDYIDRGIDSRAALLLIHELAIRFGAITLRGNHEEMFLDFLHHPEDSWALYYQNGGNTTVADLLNRSLRSLTMTHGRDYQEMILERYPWLLLWLESLPYYTEFGDYIIAHAGVDLEKEDWKQSNKEIFVWTREDFLTKPNRTGRKIIFGHTPTITLQDEGGIYFSQDDKIGIDGGAVYGHQLIGIKINHHNIIETIQINSPGGFIK